jgi:gamma-glutamyltranspeptidase/glutathione hydrolase
MGNPQQAKVLEAIGRGGRQAFYEGWPGQAIVSTARRAGSGLDGNDLSSHRGEWVDPLAGSYANWSFLELPPNGQGAVVIGAAAALDGDPLDLVSAERVHRQVEAIKAAFVEGSHAIGDPRAGGHTGGLTDPLWAKEIKASLPRQATEPPPETLPGSGGTVYVAVADANMTVSLITSNFQPFGSFVAVPECGFVLQNRGSCFRSAAPEDHPNRPAPGRRPYHTIIPALLRPDGESRWGALGVVGGPFQPQGQIQVLHHLALGLDLQAALDAPRWHWLGGRSLALERGLSALAPDLDSRGHSVTFTMAHGFGGAQLVLPRDGFFFGACEGRQDSLAAGL